MVVISVKPPTTLVACSLELAALTNGGLPSEEGVGYSMNCLAMYKNDNPHNPKPKRG